MDSSIEQVIQEILRVVQGEPLTLSPQMLNDLKRCYDILEKKPVIDWTSRQLSENNHKLAALDGFCTRLGAIESVSEKDSQLLYLFYNVICKLNFALRQRRTPVLQFSSLEALDHLQKNHYVALGSEGRAKIRGGLSRFWRSLEACTTSNYPVKSRYANYSRSEDGALPNQFHLNEFSDDYLADVRQFVIDVDWLGVLENYFKSTVGICSVRSWRYVHDPASNVNFHRDKITPSFVKAMIFMGEVTPDDGCFEFVKDSALVQVIGESPAVICSTGLYHHRALSPKPGRQRYVVELTFIPRLQDDFRVVHAGYAVGAPLNPFKEWAS